MLRAKVKKGIKHSDDGGETGMKEYFDQTPLKTAAQTRTGPHQRRASHTFSARLSQLEERFLGSYESIADLCRIC